MESHESLGHAFAMMARLLDRELRSALAQHGVLPGQLAILLELYERDGLTQTELARATGVEQPTMAATLGRMERDGLVSRGPRAGDGRRVDVLLTPRARQLEKPLIDAVRAVNRRALRGLSASERSLLYGLPDRLAANFGHG
jgi:DNA-binding MarR family transcriptional regulator